MTIRKNKSDESGRQFWNYVEETAARVEKWPEWKRASLGERSPVPTAPITTAQPKAEERKG